MKKYLPASVGGPGACMLAAGLRSARACSGRRPGRRSVVGVGSARSASAFRSTTLVPAVIRVRDRERVVHQRFILSPERTPSPGRAGLRK
jgi:hypothetical protein